MVEIVKTNSGERVEFQHEISTDRLSLLWFLGSSRGSVRRKRS